jgi:uncharacterized membrane protein YhaH (DUF805 family)
MGPVEAVSACLRRYATFSGRASRPEFWWFMGAVLLTQIVAGGIDGALFGPGRGAGGPLAALVSLALAVPVLAATWRRMHDTGRPGWFGLMHLLTLGVTGSGVALAAALTGLPAMPGPMAGGLAGGGTPALGMLPVLATLIAFALVVWWLASPGEPGENRFGPEPAR